MSLGDTLNQLAMQAQKPVAGKTMTSGAGTPSGTGAVVDVGATFAQATLNANFATLCVQINAMYGLLKNAGLMS